MSEYTKTMIQATQSLSIFHSFNGFDKWCEENTEHLEKMHDLAGLDCGIHDFSRWVYNNSMIGNKK